MSTLSVQNISGSVNCGTVLASTVTASGDVRANAVYIAGNVLMSNTAVDSYLTNHQVGRIKAWVRFNGITTSTILGSNNVSSISDLGVGTYRVNFTTALSDNNYCALISSRNGTGEAQENSTTNLPNTSNIGILCTVVNEASTTNTDMDAIYLLIIR